MSDMIASLVSWNVKENKDSPEYDDTDSDVDDEVILSEIDGMNLNEDQVHEVFAVLDGRRKRTWKENQLYKASARKDRGTFVKSDRPASSSAPRGSGGGIPGASHGRPRRREKMNKEQLKRVTKCRRCGVKGHWEEDCKQPPKSKVQGFSYLGHSQQSGGAAFSFMSLRTSFLTISQVRGAISQVLQNDHDSSSSFLTLSSGDAILDIGATQDLIGRVALTALESVLRTAGLRVVDVDAPITVPMGIGGAAEALRTILVPISPGGVPGVLEMTVLKNDIPPLLSVGFLDFLKAKIDLDKNVINLTGIGVRLTMGKLSSGHRTIPLVQWSKASGPFPVPKEIQDKYGLDSNVFDIDAPSPSEYTKVPLPSSLNLAVHTISDVIADSDHNQPQDREHGPNHREDVSKVEGNYPHVQQHEFTQSNTDSMSIFSGSERCDHSSSSRAHHLMGGASSRVDSQFDSSFSSHGVTAPLKGSTDSHRGGVDRDVEAAHDPSVPYDGDGSRDVLSSGNGRVSNQEPSFREKEVCSTAGGCQQLLHPSSRQGVEERKSICQLDSVRCLRQQIDLQVQGSNDPKPGSIQGSTQGSCIDFNDSVANTSTDMGTPEHPRISRSSGLRYSSESGGESQFIQRTTSNEAVRDFHAEPDARPYASTRTNGQQHGSVGISAAGTCTGTESNAVSFATDSSDISRGCQHDLRRGPAADSRTDANGCGLNNGNIRTMGTHDGVRGESKSVGLSRWPAWMMAPTALAVAGRAFLRPEQLSAEALARVSNHGSIEGLVLFNGLHHQVLDRVGVCPSGDDSGDLESEDATVLQEYKGSCGEEIYEHCDPRGLDGNHGSSTSGSLKKSPCDIHHSAMTQPPAPVPLPQGFKVTTKVFQGVTRPPDTQEMIGQKSLPLWRGIVDIEAQEILENQFLMWKDPDRSEWSRSHNIECQIWYLPPTVAYCFSWSDSAEHFHGLDLELQPCQEGPLWLMQSSFLTHMLVDEGKEIPHDRFERDLRACHRNLLSLISNSSASRRTSTCDLAELFSPPRVALVAQERGLRVQLDQIFDLEAGWDVRRKSCRDQFREFQRKKKPGMLVESPECKAYSQLMNVNWDRMDPSQVRQIISEGKLMWDFAVEAAEEQCEAGNYFALEHPAKASSWSTPRVQKLLRMPGVALIEFDMCAFGLTVES